MTALPLASLGDSFRSFFDAVGDFGSNIAAVNWLALLLGLAAFAIYMTLRARASFNILRAAYPESRIRFRNIWGAYMAGYGFNAVVPARGGDIVRLFLTKTSVPNSSYPAIAAAFAVGSVVMSAIVGPKRYNRAKLDSYECGIEPTPQPIGGGRIPVKYYITAMMFIVFDIEIIFLYPWAVHFDAMGLFGLVEMVVFIATVFVAYVYVWRRGGLDWD